MANDWSSKIPTDQHDQPVHHPLDHPELNGRVLMTHPARTYVDPPESLRQADEALVKLRNTMQALGAAYLLGDHRAIQRGLSLAIGHGEDVLVNLKKTHDRSTR